MLTDDESPPVLPLVDRGLRFPKHYWNSCPNNCDLTGDLIPAEWVKRGYFGQTRWCRAEGVHVPEVSTVSPSYYRCPDCGVTWHHFEEGTPERHQVQDLWGKCHHVDTWFDRSLCPEPCGSMHTICVDCQEILGGCVLVPSQS